jgi:hypothetical protein
MQINLLFFGVVYNIFRVAESYVYMCSAYCISTCKNEVKDSPCYLVVSQDGAGIKVDFSQLSMSVFNSGNSVTKDFNTKFEPITFNSLNQITGKIC